MFWRAEYSPILKVNSASFAGFAMSFSESGCGGAWLRLARMCSVPCVSDSEGCGGTSGGSPAAAVDCVSDGGLLVALAEMALAGNIGCSLDALGGPAAAFGEDQGRYVVTTGQPDRVEAAGIPVRRIGTVGGESVAGVPLTDLRAAHESFFREWMEA